MSKTLTACPHPILGCLKAAEVFLGPDRKWSFSNPSDKQRLFLASCIHAMKDVDLIPELEKIASLSHEEINSWLAEHDFQIALQPFGADTFGVASILDVLVDWFRPGEEHTMHTDSGIYTGAKLKSGFRLCNLPGHENKVVELQTKTGEKVYLMMGDAPESELVMMKQVQEWTGQLVTSQDHASELVFPAVKLDREEDISWLIKMRTASANGDPYYISEAVQQTKFRLDHLGAHVRSAAAMAMRCLGFSTIYTINQPFYCWMMRDGLELPLFSAYLDRDVWTPQVETERQY
ncbi:hypothetical protein HQ571_01825 [Candidatus Kuenenbacteria bacterium]|nr:hypothetical protein [Candidatus Kuenenbacteria bacterium]